MDYKYKLLYYYRIQNSRNASFEYYLQNTGSAVSNAYANMLQTFIV